MARHFRECGYTTYASYGIFFSTTTTGKTLHFSKRKEKVSKTFCSHALKQYGYSYRMYLYSCICSWEAVWNERVYVHPGSIVQMGCFGTPRQSICLAGQGARRRAVWALVGNPRRRRKARRSAQGKGPLQREKRKRHLICGFGKDPSEPRFFLMKG